MERLYADEEIRQKRINAARLMTDAEVAALQDERDNDLRLRVKGRKTSEEPVDDESDGDSTDDEQ